MTDKPKIIRNADLDYDQLDKELDKVKALTVYSGSQASFFGSLMCRMAFSWTSDIPTACTNGIVLWWNPYWFLKLPKPTRGTILMHELWHPAEMDMLRRGEREPRLWNIAADFRINNRLKRQGYSFDGFRPYIDGIPLVTGPAAFGEAPPEEIYDELIRIRSLEPEVFNSQIQGYWGDDVEGDMVDDTEPEEGMVILGNVTSAAQSAKMNGESLHEGAESLLKRFLQPKIAWQTLVYRWFDSKQESSYSMARPNRRYIDNYLPSILPDEGLEDLFYYWDVSGSVTEGISIRFASEVKFLKETFRPRKITIIQFDQEITDVKEFLEDDEFEDIKIIGRRGTDLAPVREHIIQHKPQAAVIFSDLECTPMEKLPTDCPTDILWIAVNNRHAVVPQGELIHISE